MHPVSNIEGILSSDVGDEVVLFDVRQNKYYVLSTVSGFVWRSADGSRSPEELAEMVAARFSVPNARELVDLALEELVEAELVRLPGLERAGEAAVQAPAQERLDRRAALQRLSAAGVTALLLPVVTGMHAPVPWHAASCDAVGKGKGTGHKWSNGGGHHTDPPGKRIGHCKYDPDHDPDGDHDWPWPPKDHKPGGGWGDKDHKGDVDDFLEDLFDWLKGKGKK